MVGQSMHLNNVIQFNGAGTQSHDRSVFSLGQHQFQHGTQQPQ